MKLIVAFRNFVKTPKTSCCYLHGMRNGDFEIITTFSATRLHSVVVIPSVGDLAFGRCLARCFKNARYEVR
jgi:hypothetical protein